MRERGPWLVRRRCPSALPSHSPPWPWRPCLWPRPWPCPSLRRPSTWPCPWVRPCPCPAPPVLPRSRRERRGRAGRGPMPIRGRRQAPAPAKFVRGTGSSRCRAWLWPCPHPHAYSVDKIDEELIATIVPDRGEKAARLAVGGFHPGPLPVNNVGRTLLREVAPGP